MPPTPRARVQSCAVAHGFSDDGLTGVIETSRHLLECSKTLIYTAKLTYQYSLIRESLTMCAQFSNNL